MRILIADDHAAVRHGLREILADAFPEALFSEASNAEEVLGHLCRLDCYVLLLDINMPGRSGFDVLGDVKRDYPKVLVVMVSGQPEDQYSTHCLQAGAAAYINKDRATEELVPVLRRVLGDDARKALRSREEAVPPDRPQSSRVR